MDIDCSGAAREVKIFDGTFAVAARGRRQHDVLRGAAARALRTDDGDASHLTRAPADTAPRTLLRQTLGACAFFPPGVSSLHLRPSLPRRARRITSDFSGLRVSTLLAGVRADHEASAGQACAHHAPRCDEWRRLRDDVRHHVARRSRPRLWLWELRLERRARARLPLPGLLLAFARAFCWLPVPGLCWRSRQRMRPGLQLRALRRRQRRCRDARAAIRRPVRRMRGVRTNRRTRKWGMRSGR